MSRPPIGTTIRHTKRYTNGLSVTTEGPVADHCSDGRSFYIGNAIDAVSVDTEPELNYGVTIEVLAPPPAPEPAGGSAAATGYTVWLHSHRGWFDGFASETPTIFLTWEQLNAQHPEVRALVYDPVTNAPDLPWSIGPDEKCATVSVYSAGAVSVWCGNGVADEPEDLNPDEARALAYAILRGAREAEQI